MKGSQCIIIIKVRNVLYFKKIVKVNDFVHYDKDEVTSISYNLVVIATRTMGGP